MRIINASETGTLVLGFQGEDQRLEIRFPLVDEKTGRNITEEFPGGSFSISIMLPGDPAEHIVGNEDFRIEGNWLIWTVKEAYTVGFGEGKLQLNYAFGGMAKSRIWKTNVRKSINSGSGTVPSWSDWKTELLNAAAAVQSAVDSYDEMTAEAEELPAGSTPTAEMDHTGDHPVLKLGIPASQGGGGGADIDDSTTASNKTWSSQKISSELSGKQNTLTFDSTPTEDSNNPVKSGGVYSALAEQSETIVQLSGTVSGKYAKPSGGIPASDMSEAVQTSLGKADTALQQHQDISGKQNKPAAAGTAGQVLGLDNSLNPVWLTDESNDFLEVNDFDAETGGKVNVLAVPYAYDDFMHGYMIFSNGTIGTQEVDSVSALIPVSKGTYGLKTKHNNYYVGDIADGNNYKNGFTFFAADGTTLVSRGEDMISLGNDIYVLDVPEDAKYVRFCFYSAGVTYRQTAVGFFNQWILLPDADTTITDDFFILGNKKADGTIDKIMRRDGSHLTIVDTEAREDAAEALARPITFGRRSFAVFEKVCCIGDSYTSGYMVDTGDQSHTDGAYSWVEHLKNMTGREYVNLGIGGATTASWLTSADGLAKMQLPANKSQAYIVALQINDAAQGLTVGTIEDIGTSAQTYYGCTSKIIDEIFDVNSDAHVFLLTQPKNFVGEHTPYRNAILAIVEWYQENGTHQDQVHLIDLLDYWKLFTTPGISMYDGHFTAVGYECVAEILLYAFSNYINENVTKFQDVFLIDWGGKGGNIP